MSNTKNHAHLSDQKMLTIVIGLCEAVAEAKTAHDAAELLTALLTPQEARTIALRLKIREMLNQGCGYDHIRSDLAVSAGTISRVKLIMEEMDRQPRHPRQEPDIAGLITLEKSPRNPRVGSSSANRKRTEPYEEGRWPIEVLGSLLREIFDRNRRSGK